MENNVKGVFMYQGIHTTSQVDNIKEFFEKLLTNEKFDIVIEIGTALAGLTYILDDIVKERNLNCVIETFDIDEYSFVKTYLNERGINYNIMNEFTPEFENVIVNMINSYNKVLLLCDGGNKINEFNKYSKYIKNGDFIMAHDFSKNKKVFEEKINNKIWNWCEITYDDISNSVENNNLIEYTNVNFEEAVWCCYYKNNIGVVNKELTGETDKNKNLNYEDSIKNLIKLKELFDLNLIDEEEFKKIKEKIINNI